MGVSKKWVNFDEKSDKTHIDKEREQFNMTFVELIRVDFIGQVEEHRPGDTITLTIIRGGKELKIPVTLKKNRGFK